MESRNEKLPSNFGCNKEMSMKSSNKPFSDSYWNITRELNKINKSSNNFSSDDSLGHPDAFVWATITQSQLYFTNVAAYICLNVCR